MRFLFWQNATELKPNMKLETYICQTKYFLLCFFKKATDAFIIIREGEQAFTFL